MLRKSSKKRPFSIYLMKKRKTRNTCIMLLTLTTDEKDFKKFPANI